MIIGDRYCLVGALAQAKGINLSLYRDKLVPNTVIQEIRKAIENHEGAGQILVEAIQQCHQPEDIVVSSPRGLTSWNDTLWRTEKQVLEVLDRAIEIAKEKEGV